MNLSLILAGLFLAGTVRTANWDLNFGMSGFTKRSTLLVTSCKTKVSDQINAALGGSKDVDCIEEPTTNQNKPHVSCVDDSRMGKAINFTLYRTDDDSATGKNDRQRLEMKVFEQSPEILKAKLNSHFVYTYWLR